jgi:hypothetical protein
MKKSVPFLLLLLPFMLLVTFSFSQSKKDQLSKNWEYAGVEEFGVVKPPDSTMKNDGIELKADGTFNMVKNGKKSSGTWSFNEKAGIVSFTDGKTKKSLSYKLKGADENILIIEYQTPDLVRTRYQYKAITH